MLDSVLNLPVRAVLKIQLGRASQIQISKFVQRLGEIAQFVLSQFCYYHYYSWMLQRKSFGLQCADEPLEKQNLTLHSLCPFNLLFFLPKHFSVF